MLADLKPPLSHDLARLQLLAGAKLSEELLELQEFAVKARYSPADTPLPASRECLLALIGQLRAVLEGRLGEEEGPPDRREDRVLAWWRLTGIARPPADWSTLAAPS